MKTQIRVLLFALSALAALGQTLQPVNLATPNSGQGDPLRTAFEKLNNNDSNLWSQAFTLMPSQIASLEDLKLSKTNDYSYGQTLKGPVVLATGARITTGDNPATFGPGDLTTKAYVDSVAGSGGGMGRTNDYSYGQTLKGPVVLDTGARITTADNPSTFGPGDLITKAYVDSFAGGGSGASAVKVFDSMAAFAADVLITTNMPKLVALTGYSVPGYGAGFWRLDLASSYPTNLAVLAVPGGGRMLPIFQNGLIDVQMFGAVPGTTNQVAVNWANTMANDFNWPDKVLYFKAAYERYYLTEMITNRTDLTWGIRGDQVGMNYNITPGQQRGASYLVMVTPNTPIIKLWGTHKHAERLTLDYANDPPETDTSAIAIWIAPQPSGSDNTRMVIRDIAIRKCAIGIYADPGVLSYNSTVEHINIAEASIGWVHWLSGGTPNQFNHWFFQNQDSSENRNMTISSATHSAPGEIALTISTALTSYLSTNAPVYITGLGTSSGASITGYKFVKRISGSTVYYDIDPGVSTNFTVTDGTGNMAFYPGEMSSYPVDIGINTSWSGTDWDLEWTKCPGGVAIRNRGEGTLQHVHLEGIWPTSAPTTGLIENRGTGFAMMGGDVSNCGLPAGWSSSLIYNGLRSGEKGVAWIGNISIRDFGNIANTFVMGSGDPTCPPPTILTYIGDASVRANTTGYFAAGTAVTPLRTALTAAGLARTTAYVLNEDDGTDTLVGGTKTVSLPWITSSTRVNVTVTATNGGTPGHLRVTKTPGASFTVTSTSGADVSSFEWTATQLTF